MTMLLSLSASLFSFALSSKVNSSCYRDEFDKAGTKSITWTRLASNFQLLRNLQQLCCKQPSSQGLFPVGNEAVLQTVAKRCLSSRDHFSESTVKTNGA